MSFQVRHNSSWETPTPYVRHSSSWKIPNEIWVKDNGVWKLVFQAVPDNAIIFYSNNSTVPTESSVVTAADDYFPHGSESSLNTTAGSATHSGSDHGSATNSYTSVTNPVNVDYRTLSANGWIEQNSTHNHTWAHTHSSTETITPENFGVIPVTGCKVLESGAVMLTAGEKSFSFWTALTDYINRYMRCVSSQSSMLSGGFATHTHASVSGNTTTYNGNLIQRSWLRTSYFSRHYHTATSNALEATNNEPPYFYVHNYLTNKRVFWNELPSGTVVYLNSTTIPSGWSLYSAAISRIPRRTSSGTTGTGGSSTHSHTRPIDPSTSSTVATATYECQYYVGDNTRRISSAQHGITLANTVNHTGTGTLLPKRINWYPIIKD